MKNILFSISCIVFFDFIGFSQTNYIPNVTVSTLAGSYKSGTADGQGYAASFNHPEAVALDSKGNIYVVDSWNSLIRKITPDGLVSTLAGTGKSGSITNGQGTAASFSYPAGIAIDAADNVYVTDFGCVIRKISPSGLVTTFAGSGQTGDVDGQGTAASFSGPLGITIDAAGNLYVSDNVNNKIKKITPGGLVTTVAGLGLAHPGSTNGPITTATFDSPWGITVDSSGNIYVIGTYDNDVRKISPIGVVTTLAGDYPFTGNQDGPGDLATFNTPNGLAVDDSGNVYVGDFGNNMIRKITPSGVVSTLAGRGPNYAGIADGAGSVAEFNSPMGLAVDASGNVYVADSGVNEIRKITVGSSITTGTVNNIISNSGICVFPNPANDFLNVTVSGNQDGTISMVNVQGKDILTQVVMVGKANISTATLQSGAYLLRFVSDNGSTSYVSKVIIAK